MDDRTTCLQDAVALFYQRAAEDPLLGSWFVDVDLPRLRRHQRDFLLMTIGGPEGYTGRELTTAHAGLSIDDAAFDRALELLTASLQDAGIAPDVVSNVQRRVAPLRASVVGV